MKTQTVASEAYQKVAHDLLPPGFLLAGESIIQTFGNIQQLFSGPVPTALSSIQQLPDGDVKSKLLKIVDSIAKGITFKQCVSSGVRVSSTSNPQCPEQDAILVVFEVDAQAELNAAVQSDSSFLDTLDVENKGYHPFCDHLVGSRETPCVMIWETDTEGRATYISEEEAEFKGCLQADLMGLGWLEYLHPDDLDKCILTFREAGERGEPFCFASRRRRFDGKYFWFKTHGVPQFDRQNALIGYKGFCQDCTRELEVQSALIANQRMIRSILDNSPHLVAFADCDLMYQYVNKNYSDFWQVPKEQIIGMTIPELTGEFFDVLEPFLNRALSGQAVKYETVAPGETADASRWLDIVHVPAFDSNGAVVGFYCFVNDVTESRKHERLLELVQSHVPAMIFLINTNLEIRHANLQFQNRLGSLESEVVDKPLSEVLGQESFGDFRNHLQIALSGQKCSFETQLNPGGRKRIDVIANIVPEFDAEGNVIGVCGLMLDVSELRNVQTELLRTEARFELAVSGSPLGVFEFDPDRPDWCCADHVEDLLGFDRGELGSSRARIRDLIHPDDREKYESNRLMLTPEDTIRTEVRLRNKNNTYRWYELFSKPVLESEGQFTYRAGTIVDINDLKTAQLESAAQVRRRDEFLAMLSHELRNPMAAIVLALDLFHTSSSVPAELCSIVDIMTRQSTQISRLLDDLLDVSRVTNNRIEFRETTHDINSSVEEVATSFRLNAKSKRQSVHIEVWEQPMIIDGDESRIKQVITNLIENAIKYTPNDGDIWVSTKHVDDSVMISVRDSGIGISSELIGNIFDLFCQGTSTIHRTSGGMGVGLFMVNHIVHAHDGVVMVNSAGPGLGSQFDVCLPLSPQSLMLDPIDEPTLPHRRHVVIVEDNDDARVMAARLLKQRGFLVTEFVDGESASLQVPKLCPNIAIIDIGLPGKSGLDLAREFRRTESLENTLLIALTGYGQESDRERFKAAGFHLHLVKPTNIDELTAAIDKLSLSESGVHVQS